MNLISQEQTVQYKVPRSKIHETIEKVILKHFEEEHQLEREAEKLYIEQGASMGPMDKGKALAMIRKQLAQAKDFVLSGGMTGRFTEDKIMHLAHLVADKLYDDDLMDFSDEDEGPKFVKKAFMHYFQQENDVIEKVRKKIQSQANAPFEGSRDWDILYKKYFEEEMKRLGHG